MTKDQARKWLVDAFRRSIMRVEDEEGDFQETEEAFQQILGSRTRWNKIMASLDKLGMNNVADAIDEHMHSEEPD